MIHYIYLFGNLHETQIKLDIKDPNYPLLKEIFKIIDSRKSA